MDAAAAKAFADLQNRIGDLQYFIDPGTGATSEGESTLRIRKIDSATGQLIASVQALATALTALQQQVSAIQQKLGA